MSCEQMSYQVLVSKKLFKKQPKTNQEIVKRTSKWSLYIQPNCDIKPLTDTYPKKTSFNELV